MCPSKKQNNKKASKKSIGDKNVVVDSYEINDKKNNIKYCNINGNYIDSRWVTFYTIHKEWIKELFGTKSDMKWLFTKDYDKYMEELDEKLMSYKWLKANIRC
jgi:hypothetical protein